MTDNKPLFKFVVLSDIHVWTKTNLRTFKLNMALKNIQKEKADAFVSTGDLTDHGEIDQWEAAAECLKQTPPAPQCVITLGNHDTWSTLPEDVTIPDYEYSLNLYRKYRKLISGVDEEKAYFTQKIKGYTFISIGSEADNCDGDISEEQIEWLDRELEKASKDKKPIFVLSHFAMNKTHGLPATFGDKEYTDTTGGMGINSDKINDVFQKYDNIFLFSGHSHMGVAGKKTMKEKGYASIETHGTVTSVNLPCYMFMNHDGLPFSGLGMRVRVYDNRLKLEFKSYCFDVKLGKSCDKTVYFV